LSTDGSLRSPTKVAAAGGVLRTYTCRFLKAFTENLGSCSIIELKCERLSTDYNSLGHWAFDVYELIPTPWRPLLSLPRILSWIINMQLLSCSSRSYICNRHWEVHLFHSYREAYNAADYLANLGHSLPYGIHIFDFLDRGSVPLITL
ncbi:hypothetical protein LINGRAHAP2_LOCUS31909, partial [Linum grandiflorum]